MSSLTDALDRIENYVQYYCQITNSESSGLAAGLSQPEIEEIIQKQAQFCAEIHEFSPLPIIFSQEIYEFYQWHNGECFGVSFISPDYSYWGLEEAIRVIGDEAQVKLFADERGSYMVVGSKEPHDTSPVYMDSKRHLHYSSLAEMMQSIAEILDMTLNLFHERGNTHGNYQERLESWRNIMQYILDDNEKRYTCDLRLLNIGYFLDDALNVSGYIEV
jgi:hypothetical protein